MASVLARSRQRLINRVPPCNFEAQPGQFSWRHGSSLPFGRIETLLGAAYFQQRFLGPVPARLESAP
jgi:hypothetical protein